MAPYPRIAQECSKKGTLPRLYPQSLQFCKVDAAHTMMIEYEGRVGHEFDVVVRLRPDMCLQKSQFLEYVRDYRSPPTYHHLHITTYSSPPIAHCPSLFSQLCVGTDHGIVKRGVSCPRCLGCDAAVGLRGCGGLLALWRYILFACYMIV